MIKAPEERSHHDELDPWIINFEPHTAAIEELEHFSVNLQDPSQVLQIGKCLPHMAKKKVMNFMLKNLNVFAWKHKGMVGIGPKVS